MVGDAPRDRSGSVWCNVTLQRDAEYTVVVFSSARWYPSIRHYPQHAMLFLLVDSDDDLLHGGLAQSAFDVRPSRYGVWYPARATVHSDLQAFAPGAWAG